MTDRRIIRRGSQYDLNGNMYQWNHLDSCLLQFETLLQVAHLVVVLPHLIPTVVLTSTHNSVTCSDPMNPPPAPSKDIRTLAASAAAATNSGGTCASFLGSESACISGISTTGFCTRSVRGCLLHHQDLSLIQLFALAAFGRLFLCFGCHGSAINRRDDGRGTRPQAAQHYAWIRCGTVVLSGESHWLKPSLRATTQSYER